VNLSVTGLVLEGHRRVDEWKQIRQHIPNQQVVPVSVQGLQNEDGDPGVQRILDLVDDDRTVQEIAIQTHSSEFHVCRLLYDQIRAGRLKAVRPRQIQPALASDHGETSNGKPRSPDPEALLDSASALISERQFDIALRHLRAAKSLEPNSIKIQQLSSSYEKKIEQAMSEKGVRLDSIPLLCSKPEEISSLDISPQEGFVLTRVNGSYDIRTILKITPVPPLEARVVFWKLLEAGHIELREPDA
jgi:hypothetical protein